MQNEGERVGGLELIIGPMFSGKTTELISRAKCFKSMGKKVLCINHVMDTRYSCDAKIVSHCNESIDAVRTDMLMTMIIRNMVQNHDVVIIEEAQFFNDLYDFVMYCVNDFRKHVVVVGLDGTYQQRPFKNVIDLIPFADDITRLYGKCNVCGKKAPFSKRLIDQQGDIIIGAYGVYICVCREHL